MKDLILPEFIYLFGAFQGFFLITVILLRARNVANFLLCLMLGLFSFYLLEQTIYLSGEIRNIPHLMFTTLPLTFLIGPLFYHFIRFNTLEKQSFRLVHLMHLLPFLYEVAILMPFYLLSASQKLDIYQLITNNTDQSFSFDLFRLGYIIYLLSTIWFLILSYKLLFFKTAVKRDQMKKRKILRWVSRFFLGYLLANAIVLAASMLGFSLLEGWQHTSLILLTLIIHCVGYICFLSPELIIQTELREKYVNSSLSEKQIRDHRVRLVQYVQNEQLYLMEKISPAILSEAINVTTADLSQILSEGLDTNFYRFINEYRVAHAKKLLRSEQYAKAKMIHIAFDSGFSNKTSFLRNFKEVTGLTPTAYKSGSTPLSEALEA